MATVLVVFSSALTSTFTLTAEVTLLIGSVFIYFFFNFENFWVCINDLGLGLS